MRFKHRLVTDRQNRKVGAGKTFFLAKIGLNWKQKKVSERAQRQRGSIEKSVSFNNAKKSMSKIVVQK